MTWKNAVRATQNMVYIQNKAGWCKPNRKLVPVIQLSVRKGNTTCYVLTPEVDEKKTNLGVMTSVCLF